MDQERNLSYAFLLKYIIVGDMSVGKSCLMTQFIDRKFSLSHDSTIGIEFGSRFVEIDKDQQEKTRIKIQIWDTAGQESFKSVTRSYYRGTICALLVYDITSLQSFQNIEKWMKDTNEYGNQNVQKLLVGNKNDLVSNRQVTFDQGLEFARTNQMEFIETSAKTGYNVDAAFEKSAKLIFEKIQNHEIQIGDQSIGIKYGSESIFQLRDSNEVELEQEKKQKYLYCC